MARVQVPVSEITVGTRLWSKKTRVHAVLSHPNGDVTVGYKVQGSKAPGIRLLKKDEKVWVTV